MPPAGPARSAPQRPARRAGPCRPLALALAAGGLWLASLTVAAQPGPAAGAARPKAAAAAPTPAGPAKAARAAKATQPASPRQQLRNQAKGLALASATAEAISDAQLDIATRVLTGRSDCEFLQTVDVQAHPSRPGHFMVAHAGKRFQMTPRETSTGAVRLEDATAGVVWLQIPSKSMLMNARAGQRMVDSCLHAEQRAAQRAVADASQALGIVPIAATPAAAGASAAAAERAGMAASAAGTGPVAAGAASPAASVPVAPAASAASAAPPAPAALAPAAATAASAAPAVPAASATSN